VVESQEPCEYLEWDTTFFGFPIARVRSNSLTPELATAIDNWCAEHRTHCLYFLARPDDASTTRTAEDHGFRLMDVRLVFEHELGSIAPPSGNSIRVRPVESGDVDALLSIAQDSYHDTRFYFDAKFPRHLCDSLYRTWIKLSCEGYADAVLVAETDGLLAGYISCHLDNKKNNVGKIGLVGVATQARGRGIGQALVCHALEWFRGANATKVSVVTQGRNVSAQRLYQRYGFATESVHLWYHKWFE